MRRKREGRDASWLGREVKRKKAAGGAARGRELVCKKCRDAGGRGGGGG